MCFKPVRLQREGSSHLGQTRTKKFREPHPNAVKVFSLGKSMNSFLSRYPDEVQYALGSGGALLIW